MTKPYAPIEPYASGLLETSDGHVLYWEEVGNPDGTPALYLHGGKQGERRSKPQGSQKDAEWKNWYIFDGHSEKDIEEQKPGERQDSCQDKVVCDFGEDDIGWISNGIVIDFSPTPFPNKTFRNWIDHCKEDGYPKQRSPYQRGNQIFPETKREIANESGTEKINYQTRSNGLLSKLKGELFLKQG